MWGELSGAGWAGKYLDMLDMRQRESEAEFASGYELIYQGLIDACILDVRKAERRGGHDLLSSPRIALSSSRGSSHSSYG